MPAERRRQPPHRECRTTEIAGTGGRPQVALLLSALFLACSIVVLPLGGIGPMSSIALHIVGVALLAISIFSAPPEDQLWIRMVLNAGFVAFVLGAMAEVSIRRIAGPTANLPSLQLFYDYALLCIVGGFWMCRQRKGDGKRPSKRCLVRQAMLVFFGSIAYLYRVDVGWSVAGLFGK